MPWSLFWAGWCPGVHRRMGENSAEVRAAACHGLEFLGLRLDNQANARPSLDQDISTADSRVRILVIRAEEDWAMANVLEADATGRKRGNGEPGGTRIRTV